MFKNNLLLYAQILMRLTKTYCSFNFKSKIFHRTTQYLEVISQKYWQKKKFINNKLKEFLLNLKEFLHNKLKDILFKKNYLLFKNKKRKMMKLIYKL